MNACAVCDERQNAEVARWEQQVKHHCRVCPAHSCPLLTELERAELIAMHIAAEERFQEILKTKRIV